MAIALLALPLLGAMAALVLATSFDLEERPYASVSEQVQQLEWRDRYALAQAFLAHAEGMGVGPMEAHDCVREIADGSDLSPCMPARADRIEASVLLLENLMTVLAHREAMDRGLRSPAGEDPRFRTPEGVFPYGGDGMAEGDEEVEGEGCPAWDDPGDDALDDDESIGRNSGALEI